MGSREHREEDAIVDEAELPRNETPFERERECRAIEDVAVGIDVPECVLFREAACEDRSVRPQHLPAGHDHIRILGRAASEEMLEGDGEVVGRQNVVGIERLNDVVFATDAQDEPQAARRVAEIGGALSQDHVGNVGVRLDPVLGIAVRDEYVAHGHRLAPDRGHASLQYFRALVEVGRNDGKPHCNHPASRAAAAPAFRAARRNARVGGDSCRSRVLSVKILQTTHSAPYYIPPPVLDPSQVVCGPRYPDRAEHGRIVSLVTPAGEFDLATVVERLPREQRPELLVVNVDSARNCLPRNVAALGCRAVAVVGDTHHLDRPIASNIDYLLRESFDAVILTYTRQHAHFFIEAGLDRVYWLPGFNVRRIPIPSALRKDVPFSFAGRVSEHHARRAALVMAIAQAGLPIELGDARFEMQPGATIRRTRHLHARSAISLNCSLNGDLNLRTLEILASGSCALTDRLGAESGLDLLFEEGRHIVYYDSFQDCIDQAQRLLRNPGRAEAVARAGRDAYEQLLAPERIQADFFALVGDRVVRPEFDLAKDRRTLLPRAHDRAGLARRIEVYEFLQALQLRLESVSVLMTPDIDPYLISDAADLQRVALAVNVRGADEKAKKLAAFLSRAGVSRQLRLVVQPPKVSAGECYVVLTTLADWRERRPDRLLAGARESVIVIPDFDDASSADRELATAGLERLNGRLPIFASSAAGPPALAG